jgi:hypothetical protein
MARIGVQQKRPVPARVDDAKVAVRRGAGAVFFPEPHDTLRHLGGELGYDIPRKDGLRGEAGLRRH